MSEKTTISVCVPVYNGAATIGELVQETLKELESDFDVEIVLVNDFSSDNSHDVCREIALTNTRVKFVSLRKNFGEHNAVMCALNYATGDYIAIIDDDFQNPPKEIRTMVREAEKGFDVVYSKFADKRHSTFRNLGSQFNNRVANWLLEKPSELYLSSFKVIERSLVKRLIEYRGPSPYIDGLILRETRNISSVTVIHEDRREGQSNYTIAKLVALWLNMFINFSVKPLRLFSLFGMFVTALSFLAAAVFIFQKFLDPELQIGWTSVMVGILFFSGIQIIFLGLIGEYVGKNYLQVNGTPQWAIREIITDGGAPEKPDE